MVCACGIAPCCDTQHCPPGAHRLHCRTQPPTHRTRPAHSHSHTPAQPATRVGTHPARHTEQDAHEAQGAARVTYGTHRSPAGRVDPLSWRATRWQGWTYCAAASNRHAHARRCREPSRRSARSRRRQRTAALNPGHIAAASQLVGVTVASRTGAWRTPELRPRKTSGAPKR